MAQVTVKGIIVDADTDDPLVGATVTVIGTSYGTITDVDGRFILTYDAQQSELEFNYLGYKDVRIRITQSGNIDLGKIPMNLDAMILNDVVVKSTIAVPRKTPVAVSNVLLDYIEEKIGTQEFVEILKTTPGVHANRQG
ncbi:MAG: carboxypeptidase-like regulatory domain-containing protein, partial [Bacteroides sp.]|nr:carboxypeptidase-like regulatory domain-containing protein [Bacteroides sp.]